MRRLGACCGHKGGECANSAIARRTRSPTPAEGRYVPTLGVCPASALPFRTTGERVSAVSSTRRSRCGPSLRLGWTAAAHCTRLRNDVGRQERGPTLNACKAGPRECGQHARGLSVPVVQPAGRGTARAQDRVHRARATHALRRGWETLTGLAVAPGRAHGRRCSPRLTRPGRSQAPAVRVSGDQAVERCRPRAWPPSGTTPGSGERTMASK